ncbi:MAG: WD40 repeat domain-containing protein [Cyclobacteriaceae bacterium]|jgi:WD40 repeat protein|nr:WD40 repeat domain-containing protein [Cyclobacteriaceae bacterium]
MSPLTVSKVHTLTGHRDCVYTLERDVAETHFFSAGGDGMVVRWDLRAPEAGELIAQLPNSIYAIHRIPHSSWLVVGHNYEGIHVLDVQSKKEIASLRLTDAAIFDVLTVGAEVWVACGDGTVAMVDSATWTVKTKIRASDKSARCLALHPQGNEVAVGYSDHHVRIIDVGSHRVKHTWPAHQNSVFSLSFTPAGDRLITASRDARLKAWRWPLYDQTNEVVAHLFAINHVAWHAQGHWFATGSMDKSVKVWDGHALKLLKVIDKARHAGHGTSVNKLLWSSFNHWLISASDDRSISVWQVTGP